MKNQGKQLINFCCKNISFTFLNYTVIYKHLALVYQNQEFKYLNRDKEEGGEKGDVKEEMQGQNKEIRQGWVGCRDGVKRYVRDGWDACWASCTMLP